MSYLVQASPISKIFLPEYKERCLADPDFLMKSFPFEITIPRPCGAIKLIHNKPVHAASLLPKSSTRKVEEDEISPLLHWLTDEKNEETNPYGVVSVSVESDISEAISAIAMGDEKNMAGLLKKVTGSLKKSIDSARERADERVKTACAKMYDITKQTFDQMKKDGKGTYMPSLSEALALKVLASEIKKHQEPSENAQRMFNEAMQAVEARA